MGLVLSLFLLISATTGILLAWKKQSATIQPPTQKGTSTEMKEWLPLSHLSNVAKTALLEQLSLPKSDQTLKIDRIDARPSKGMVKVLFDSHNWEVQVDASTGKILSIDRRHSDWIEAVHDGSIISQNFKLISMNLLGIGLILLVLAGFWLWYGPKQIRKLKKRP